MTEREMEDLVAEFPADFFPRKKLLLRGRQQSFGEVGRFDLLFGDEFQTTILMELKARPAKYEDASQLARYKDELENRGEQNLLMWLVAPQIPNSVREFLDRIGIEYSEIHIAEFQQVARRHNVSSVSNDGVPAEAASADQAPRPLTVEVRRRQPRDAASASVRSSVETGPTVVAPAAFRWSADAHNLVLLNRDALDNQRLSALVGAFEDAVPSRRNAHLVADLRRWASAPREPLRLSCCQSLLRWVITTGWKSAVPSAEAIWTYLFGSPAPTWQTWNGGKYIFDSAGWKRWYASLPH